MGIEHTADLVKIQRIVGMIQEGLKIKTFMHDGKSTPLFLYLHSFLLILTEASKVTTSGLLRICT